MIRSKTHLYLSFFCFIICVALFFPYPNNHLFDARVTFLFFPLKDGNGFIPMGVVGSLLFILTLAMLVLGLKKFHTLAVIIVSSAFILLPLLVISIIQQTFASGIYAISYDNAGECRTEEVKAMTVKAECFIKLTNYSNQEISFTMELIDSFPPEQEAQFESLLNLDGPIQVTLLPNEEKVIHLDGVIDISKNPNQIAIGTSHHVHFKLKDGEKERVF